MYRGAHKKCGALDVQVFAPRLSKFIIDEIDMDLAKHCCFADEEVGLIINHDIKYRMGSDVGEE